MHQLCGNQANDGTRGRYALLYANSDGRLRWGSRIWATLPRLALAGLRARHRQQRSLEGDGVGVYYDKHEPDPSRRYKAIGDVLALADARLQC